MKAYLKDCIPFILFFYSQCIVIVVIAQLSAIVAGIPMNMGTIVYLFVLPTCFLIIYLLFRYYKFRDFYRTINPDTEESVLDAAFPDPPNLLLDNVKTLHERETNQYAEEIENLKQQKQLEFNFIQQWVHQMKTPVSVMHLTLQKEKLTLPEDFHHSMQEELERLQQGLDLALYQSRLQKFDRDFHVQKVVLKALIKETIKDFKSSFIRNQVFPAVTIDENLVVATDPKWLLFVLSQVIANAIKYSRDNSDKIYFTALEQDKALSLEVRDTGYGIPSEDVGRVFDPFFTGLNGRAFRESTGMGLYLSKEICDALGHELMIDSEKDKGTAVTITFFHG